MQDETQKQKMETTIGETTLSLETGTLARQAGGSVIGQYGETVVLAATVMAKTEIEGKDFFPLMVDYRERMYAAGKLPGGFFKREAAPRDREILAARLVDRSLRPLFQEWMRREVQIYNLILCADGANNPDVVALNAAATAVHLSEIPFDGPVAAVRVGRIDGQFVANPTFEQLATSTLDLVIAATGERIVMIEGSADQLPEADIKASLEFAVGQIRPILEMQNALREKIGKPKADISQPEPPSDEIVAAVKVAATERIKAAVANPDKLARETGTAEAKEAAAQEVAAKFPEDEAAIRNLVAEIEWEAVRDMILDTGTRPDGRGFKEIRPVSTRTGVLPRTHGSAIFQRGQTQALVTVTLGTEEDAQEIEPQRASSEISGTGVG